MNPSASTAPTLKAVDHYIGGQRLPSSGAAGTTLNSPVDGKPLGLLHPASTAELDQTVAAAQKAFLEWRATPVKERVQPLFRFKQLVEDNIAELSQLVTAENGKTPAESEAGIRKGLEVVEYATSLPQLITGELLEVSSGVDCYTRSYPLGVTAGITPFNFPAMVPFWMFPLAIATGNSFILKPSDQVPFTPLRLAELLSQAGLPAGVFNVLQGGRETVEALLDHRGIAAAAFVGSTPVARTVYARGTAAGKRMLALGGAKNHLVVMPDADPEVTARNVVSSAMGCAGQRCMAASVLLAVGNCDHIIEAIINVARGIRLGQDMGAIINPKARDRIVGYIDRAAAGSTKVLLDGRGAKVAGKEGGNYVGPTIIDGVVPGQEWACDEIFGPVLSILRVKALDEALAIENASPFGNAAAIYTSDGGTAAYFEARANAGMVGINIGVPVPREPFAFGGWNESRFGIGDITGRDGLAFWTKTRKVTKKWSAASAKNWMS
ncbi:CoA-acylating methylmalonate-semialdehyde dehydrogenase [Oleiharenicola lentus]|uniref:CoA-acylating methylmalonate-semialdehyde dehydrogenase n=1 Tax=Oleiharenicola lentus TaxID=2508720 RepID=A0A4Q1CAK6_9BACT|nr:CoA-acylating methylmalonate-semialdehyde dehydrogenase [Oleiharenicola lentus]RXK55926.1 CoA-acylating methylmalonate-semialdehyde dehydrogenase [Oleiharenicola lentus]